MRLRKLLASSVVAALSVSVIGGTFQSARAEFVSPDSNVDQLTAVYVAPDGSETTYTPGNSMGVEEMLSRNSAAQGFVGPIWAACGVKDPHDKLVHQYDAGAPPMGAEFLRKPNLKCGNEKYGYRHIKLEHMDDWGNIATRVGGNWRDFASFAIQSSLEAPAKACLGGNNEIIYLGVIELRNSNGLVGERYYPRVTVGQSTNNIITAFPQKDLAGCP